MAHRLVHYSESNTTIKRDGSQSHTSNRKLTRRTYVAGIAATLISGTVIGTASASVEGSDTLFWTNFSGENQ